MPIPINLYFLSNFSYLLDESRVLLPLIADGLNLKVISESQLRDRLKKSAIFLESQ